jgi:hypothetical protein
MKNTNSLVSVNQIDRSHASTAFSITPSKMPFHDEYNEDVEDASLIRGGGGDHISEKCKAAIRTWAANRHKSSAIQGRGAAVHAAVEERNDAAAAVAVNALLMLLESA